MKEIHTLGRWAISIEPNRTGGVDFYIQTPATNKVYVTSGWMRSTWSRQSIRKAWNKVMERVNKEHSMDSEALAGLAMATDIAENHLSEAQIEDLLGAVLS